MIRVKDTEAVIYTDSDVAALAVTNTIYALQMKGQTGQIGPLLYELASLGVGGAP